MLLPESRLKLDGATLLLGIVGDPVAQVKAPWPLSQLLQQRGFNALLVPLQARAADVPHLLNALAATRNFAGLIVTVPHKQLVANLNVELSERSRNSGAVNLLRKNALTCWEAELLDGVGFVAGLVRRGLDPRGRTGCLVGAGGAASAIAFALADAGAAAIRVHDIDAGRQHVLLQRLRGHHIEASPWDGRDTRGADLLINATPVGMRPGDGLPVPVEALRNGLWVAEVIMQPEITPLLAEAARRGCVVHGGRSMMEEQIELMLEFFDPALRRAGAEAVAV